MTKETGGLAFPRPAVFSPVLGLVSVEQDGMTLRDWFAGLAMQAAITGHIAHYGHDNCWPPRGIATYVDEIADAMLEARK